jgi:outer membrane protein TolC
MSILLRVISLAYLPCLFLLSSAVIAQEPINKQPLAEKDLRDDPLLKAKSLPVPPLPDLTRVGVGGGELSLTLNQAIRRALENNNDIEVSRDNVRLAETTLKSLEGVYDPLINLTPQFSDAVTPRLNTAGETGVTTSTLLHQSSLSFFPSLTKQFSTGGGQYQVYFNSLRGTEDFSFTQISPFYTVTLGSTFTQPLLRNRSIDQFRHNIRVQRKVLSQTDSDFRLQVITVITNVQQAYWELVYARKNELNQIENVNLAREQLRMIEEQISVGISATLDRAQALTQIASAETLLLSATQNVTTAENVLKQLILRTKSAMEWSNRIKPTDEPQLVATPINLKEALDEAYANRPELTRLRLQQDINKIDTKFFKNQTLPRVDLQSTMFSEGVAGRTLTRAGVTSRPPSVNVGGYGQALRNLGRLDTTTVSAGFTIQFPLHNQTAKANLAGARIQGEQLIASIQSMEQAVEIDVRNAVQAVETTKRQVDTARAASKSAEIQLAGELKRYQAGMSTTFLVFQFEDQLVVARTLEVRAEANYSQALANLQRATSVTLRVNRVTIDKPIP